jgi:hypothetical protein
MKSPKSNLSRASMQCSLELRPVATATVAQVLRPQGLQDYDLAPAPRHILPATFERGSAAEYALNAAACYVRSAMTEGTFRPCYDREAPEFFWSAMADTAVTALEAVDCIADKTEASIAEAIFQAAGWYSDKLRALTARAKVEIQVFVMHIASKVKYLSAKQSALEFGSVRLQWKEVQHEALCYQ